MKGKYERNDGTRFDVRQEKGKFEYSEESNGLKNRLFYPVSEEEIKQQISDGEIKKIET